MKKSSASKFSSLLQAEVKENPVHFFSDHEWMAVRHFQMDVAPNCIFPARESKSVTRYLQMFRTILVAAVKLPIRL